jgi:hypothetical protein
VCDHGSLALFCRIGASELVLKSLLFGDQAVERVNELHVCFSELVRVRRRLTHTPARLVLGATSSAIRCDTTCILSVDVRRGMSS